MLAASSHDRNNDPESNHITVAVDVRTAFLHADVDQDLFAEPREPCEYPGKSELPPTPDGFDLLPKR